MVGLYSREVIGYTARGRVNMIDLLHTKQFGNSEPQETIGKMKGEVSMASFMKRISPEYVVEHAIKDMRISGLEGLKPYLTEKAESNVDAILTVSGGVSLLMGGNQISILFSRLSECDWTVVEILKGTSSAKAVLGFAIRSRTDEIEGTLQLTLIKEEKEWRIDGVDTPKFSKFTVSSTGDSQS